MSRSEAERACFDLRESDGKATFESDPGHYLNRYELTMAERLAIKTGDVGLLFAEGLIFGALDALGRQFGYDNEAYVSRLRAASGRPVNEEQIELLRPPGSREKEKLMAQLVSLLAAAHAPGQTSSPNAAGPEKLAAITNVWNRLETILREASPDVLIAISNDHYQNFLAAVPPFCVGTGDSHSLPHEKFAEQLRLETRLVEGAPDIAELLLEVSEEEGMPLAFSERLIFIDELSLPAHFLKLDRKCRLVPVLTNCLHRNRPKPQSFLRLGEIIAKAIERAPSHLRIAVLATGGLSHDPMGPDWGLIDRDFDRRFLSLVEEGRIAELLEEVTLERMDAAGKGGTPETLNWFCALGLAGPGARAEILAYVPVPEWATGLGYAAWPVQSGREAATG